MNAILDLYIFVYDKNSQHYQIVSTDPENLQIPYINITENSDIELEAKKIFEKYMMLSSQYTTIKISNAEIRDKTLHLNYYSLSPFSCKTKEGSFLLNAQKYAVISKNIQQIINIL